jgi:plasmid stabilization system protein ParE
MKLTFQPRVPADLRWFKRYFGEGTEAAINKYYKTLDLICASPGMGRPVSERDAREYAILRIPFSIIYRVKVDRIEVLRVWDQRADRVSLWEKA